MKVLAGLLTYQTDRPQEGRIRLPQDDVEMRVCTYPTLHGERAVVRLFGGAKHYQHLDDLGLPDDVLPTLQRLLTRDLGGDPRFRAGRQRQDDHGLRLSAGNRPAQRRRAEPDVSIEDPIEVAVGGVAQSQVHPTVGLGPCRRACGSSCGKTPRSSWSARSATAPRPRPPCKPR